MTMSDEEFRERLIKTKKRWAQIEQSFETDEDTIYEEVDEIEEEQERKQEPKEKRCGILGIFDEFIEE